MTTERIPVITTLTGGREATTPQYWIDRVTAEAAADPDPMTVGVTTVTAMSDGLWSAVGTWDNGVPTTGDVVLIPSGRTVTYDVESSLEIEDIVVEGNLNWATDTDTKLVVDTIFGKMGSSVTMGTAANPITDSGTPGKPRVDIVFKVGAGQPGASPRLGLMTMGPLTMHGAVKDTRVNLATNLTAGATQIELASAPVGWQVGDSILIPSTQWAGYTATDVHSLGPTTYWAKNGRDDREQPYQSWLLIEFAKSFDEVRTITGISGSTITINSALTYDHYGVSDTLPRGGAISIDVPICMLSHSVRFSSDDPTVVGNRAHTMCMFDGNDIRYAEALNMGRTLTDPTLTSNSEKIDNGLLVAEGGANLADPNNVRGRYGWHFHKIGPFFSKKQNVLFGVSAWAPTDEFPQPGWAITHHESRATIEQCIVYNVRGAGMVSELGNEIGQWLDNVVCWVRGDGFATDWGMRAEVVENHNGHLGIAYDSQSRQMLMQGNWAGSCKTAYEYFQQSVNRYPRTPDQGALRLADPMTWGSQKDVDPGDDNTYGVEQAQIPPWNDNVASACEWGFSVRHRQFIDLSDQVPMIAKNYKTINCVKAFVLTNYSYNYHFHEFLFFRDAGVGGTAIQIDNDNSNGMSFVDGVVRNYSNIANYKSMNYGGLLVDIDTTIEGGGTGLVNWTLTDRSYDPETTAAIWNCMGVSEVLNANTDWMPSPLVIHDSANYPIPYPNAGNPGKSDYPIGMDLPSPWPPVGVTLPSFVLDPGSDTQMNQDSNNVMEISGIIYDAQGIRRYPDHYVSVSTTSSAATSKGFTRSRQNYNATGKILVERNGCFNDNGTWKMRLWFVDLDRSTGDYFNFSVDIVLAGTWDTGFREANVVDPAATEPDMTFLAEATELGHDNVSDPLVTWQVGEAGSADFIGDTLDAGWTFVSGTADPTWDKFNLVGDRLFWEYDVGDDSNPGTAGTTAGQAAPRIETDMPVGDFNAHVMVATMPHKYNDGNYRGYGFCIYEEGGNSSRWDVYCQNDTGTRGTVVYCTSGAGNISTNDPSPPGGGSAGFPTHINISRTGDSWLLECSYDGIVFQTIATATLAGFAPTKFGVYAFQIGDNGFPFQGAIDHVHIGEQRLPFLTGEQRHTTIWAPVLSDLSEIDTSQTRDATIEIDTSNGPNMLKLTVPEVEGATARFEPVADTTAGNQGLLYSYTTVDIGGSLSSMYAGVQLRANAWRGVDWTTTYGPPLGWVSEIHGQTNLQRVLTINGDEPTSNDGAYWNFIVNKSIGGAPHSQWSTMRAEVIGPIYRQKTWLHGTPEPEAWDHYITDNSIRDPGTFGVAWAKNIGQTTGTGELYLWDIEVYSIEAPLPTSNLYEFDLVSGGTSWLGYSSVSGDGSLDPDVDAANTLITSVTVSTAPALNMCLEGTGAEGRFDGKRLRHPITNLDITEFTCTLYGETYVLTWESSNGRYGADLIDSTLYNTMLADLGNSTPFIVVSADEIVSPPQFMDVDTGVFNLTGHDATLAPSIDVDTGVFDLIGHDVPFGIDLYYFDLVSGGTSWLGYSSVTGDGSLDPDVDAAGTLITSVTVSGNAMNLCVNGSTGSDGLLEGEKLRHPITDLDMDEFVCTLYGFTKVLRWEVDPASRYRTDPITNDLYQAVLADLGNTTPFVVLSDEPPAQQFIDVDTGLSYLTGYPTTFEPSSGGAFSSAYSIAYDLQGVSTNLEMDTGVFDLVGHDVTLRLANIKLDADTGLFELTGYDAFILDADIVPLETGVFDLTGHSATLPLTDKVTTFDTGPFDLTGYDATFTQTSAVLDADTGLFDLTGHGGFFFGADILPLETGVFDLTGHSATLTRSAQTLATETGLFDLTGYDAVISLTERILTTQTGLFTLTGVNVTVEEEGKLSAETGVFDLTGQDTQFAFVEFYDVDTGVFNLTGHDTALSERTDLHVDTGVFDLTGYDAEVRFITRTLSAETGVFELVGHDMLFSSSIMLRPWDIVGAPTGSTIYIIGA